MQSPSINLAAYRAKYAAKSSCGPSDLNGATLCSDSVVPGPGVRIPKVTVKRKARSFPVQLGLEL